MRYDLLDARPARARAAHRGDDGLRVDLRARALAARRPVRRARRRASSPTPTAAALRILREVRARARDRHLVAGEPVPHHGRGARRDALLVRLRLVPRRGRAARDRPAVRAASGTRSAASTCERDGGSAMAASDAPRSLLIASEPLTVDTSTWLEVPEYSMLTAALDARRRSTSRRSTSMSDGATPRRTASSPSSPTVPLLDGHPGGGAGGARAGPAPARAAGGRGAVARGRRGRGRCC